MQVNGARAGPTSVVQFQKPPLLGAIAVLSYCIYLIENSFSAAVRHCAEFVRIITSVSRFSRAIQLGNCQAAINQGIDMGFQKQNPIYTRTGRTREQ